MLMPYGYVTDKTLWRTQVSHLVSDVRPAMMSCYPFKFATERSFVLYTELKTIIEVIKAFENRNPPGALATHV